MGSCSTARARRFRIANLDQRIGERMFENAIVGFGQRPSGARARPTCRRFVPAPRRRRGGSGPRRLSSSIRAGRRLAVAPEARRHGSRPGGPSRRDRSKKSRTNDRAAGSSIRASVQTMLRRKRGEADRCWRPSRSSVKIAPFARASREAFDRVPLHGRPWVAEQRR